MSENALSEIKRELETLHQSVVALGDIVDEVNEILKPVLPSERRVLAKGDDDVETLPGHRSSTATPSRFPLTEVGESIFRASGKVKTSIEKLVAIKQDIGI